MNSPPSLRPLLWLVAAALFIQTLDSAIVNTALPAMAVNLGESALAMHAIVVAYTLTMALLMPASGWLADRYGTRSVFIWAAVVFAIGSLLCALSASLQQLVLARVVQGLGGALLLPIGRLTVLRTVPRAQFLSAMSFIAVPGLLGPLVGPALGGWLVEVASWHWIFLINLPVCLVGALLAWRHLPNVQEENPPAFDVRGFTLLALGMLLFSLGLEALASQQIPWQASLVMLAAAVLSVRMYWAHAQHYSQPLFAPSLVQVDTLRLGLLGNIASRMGSAGMPYLIPLFLQLALGYTPMQAGLMMIPSALSSMLAKRLVTRLIARYGYRRVLVFNTIAIGLVIMCFALLTKNTPLAATVALFSFFGLCISLQFTAMNTLTLRDVSAAQASSANSLLSMMQMSAISLGVACAALALNSWRLFLNVPIGSANFILAFQASFITLGAITMVASRVFAHLPVWVDEPGQMTETMQET